MFQDRKNMDYFSKKSMNNKDSELFLSNSERKISINLPKYQRVPCDCELVNNLADFKRLKSQITFDTSTKTFYKSNVNNVELLENGLPYMKCPRHSLYFSDIIRLYVSNHINNGKSLPRRILLFDCFSYYDENKSYLHVDNNSLLHYNDDKNFNGSLFTNNQIKLSPRHYEERNLNSYINKHIICNKCQNERRYCICNDKYYRNYAKENSVVADVLSEHGIDVVLPPEDYYILNNPVFNYRVKFVKLE